ncbi:response regulator [Altericista sp. CCNU0014]|uniref:response regulator n=1 Tax=Altericista sp. CCNU0014 TaxID=3082949 RepID=UPI00384F3640
MIRVLLVDDQSIIRQGLAALLQLEPDLQVVGEAEHGQAGIELAIALYETPQRPDVMLMDMRMPVMDGVAATQGLLAQFPDLKILILTTFNDEAYVKEAIRLGACGYLLKDTPSEDLAAAIRSVHKGYVQFGPGIMKKAFASAPTGSPPESDLPPALTELTPREREVLRLIAAGSSNREIARSLYISEGTVKNHVTNILNRLELRDRTQAAILANTHADWFGQNS